MADRRREARQSERTRTAGAAARAATGSALAACLAEIGAAFDQAAASAAFKMRIARLIRLGPAHPALRARYGSRAAQLAGRDLDAAIAAVERWWRAERQAFAIARAFGCGSRLSLDVLRELRLILRLLRRKRMAAQFPAIVAAVCDEPMAMAAE